jgi:putative ATP-binding cassette transporter
MAWTWSAATFLLVLANLAVAVGLNRWNKWFFDALERRESNTLLTAVVTIIVLVVAGAGLAVLMVRCRMTLQIRWREWITGELLNRWMSDERYYRLAITDVKQINPEYRMADDVRMATELIVDFAISFVNAVLTAITFVGILFFVGGSLKLSFWDYTIWIPGYVAIAAVIYASAVSSITYFVGRPLVDADATKNEGEAQFRYELTRIRENSESIVRIKGAGDERKRLNETFLDLVKRWMAVVRHQSNLTWVLNGNVFFSPIFALLLATPKYLTGELSLGSVMQIATAFVAVLGALNWFTENFIRLAEWSASARRVEELHRAIDELDVASLTGR